MERPHLLVIGAGMSGLSTGVHGAMSGYDVDVFEHHDRPGGVCASWTREGYTIDGCIHWLMGSGPNGTMRPLYEEVGAFDGVELVPIHSFARSVGPGGERIDWVGDLDAIVAQVRDLSPPDAPLFEDLMEVARTLQGFQATPFDAPELMGPFDRIGALWEMRHHAGALRYMVPISDVAARIEHPFLRSAFVHLFLPGMPMLFGLVVFSELSQGNLTRPRGGSSRLPEAIAKRLETLGGHIHYHSDVEEILVEGGRAVGLRLTDGTAHAGDHIVSTAPGYTTIFRMLGGAYTDRQVRERYTQWPVFQGVALVSFGVEGTWPDLPPIVHLELQRPLVVLGHAVDRLLVRNMTDDPTLAPPGHTVLQVMLETPFDLWHDLHHAPNRYAQAKELLAETVLPVVTPLFPGWNGDTKMVDVATPYTFWRFARSWRGSFEGWLPTMDVVRERPRKNLPGLHRFHMAGQWVEPGGGIPPAITSGRHVVQLVCREDGQTFHAAPAGRL